MQPTRFDRHLEAALAGGAIGDAMGAPVEGSGPAEILELLEEWDFARFVPPRNWDGVSQLGKGNGHITDDTLMVEALMTAYGRANAHLDAFGYRDRLLPVVVNERVWVPERQAEMPIFERLWFPEKFPRWRLEANADPRCAGIGNLVNCGVAMWIMPVGAVNAGDPWGAYQEAAAIALAHNESFAVEAAAVLAAAHAEAFRPGSTPESVIDTALALARDGTRPACAAAVAAAEPGADLRRFIACVRAAVAPFDQRSEHTADDAPFVAGPGVPTDIGRPSRTKSIEELPVALAALRYGAGDFLKTLRAAVCYGRDCDSIAGMACGLFGSIFGPDPIPAPLRRAVDEANRRDFTAIARRFAAVVRSIREQDRVREARRAEALG